MSEKRPKHFVELKLAPQGCKSSSQVRMQDFYKINRGRGTSAGLTLSVLTAKDLISKLNFHDLSHLLRLEEANKPKRKSGGRKEGDGAVGDFLFSVAQFQIVPEKLD